jgi:arginyl-tRNA synthetase
VKPLIHALGERFRSAIQSAFLIESEPFISVAQNASFGDYQCSAAMGLVKRLAKEKGEKLNPRSVAEKIVANLDLVPMASKDSISIAGPGFINIVLSPEWLSSTLTEVTSDSKLGVEPDVMPTRVVVDYSGPNIAKQMHVGHLRSTIIGDCLARVFEFEGHEVIRQNHLGDWGTQFGMLITLMRLSGMTNSQDSHIEDLEDFYRQAKQRFDEGGVFQDESRSSVVKLQAGGEEELNLWSRIVEETRRHYQPIYERLNVTLKPENERGESFYNPMLAETVNMLKSKGIAVESEGAVVIFVEGFESPLIIQKSGGGYLYGTTDLAAIRYRTQSLGAHRIIYVHDSRQGQHFAQVFDAAQRAGWAQDVALEFASFGTMLGADNRPFKTRDGGTVKLKDLLDEAVERAFALVSAKNPDLPENERREIATKVGIGAVKYSDLCKDRSADYVFSWDSILSMDGNTGPYLQYAYTRIQSIFRKAAASGLDSAASTGQDILLNTADGKILLEMPQEVELAREILRLGEVLALVARDLRPHVLCSYLFTLATTFNGFYENCPVLHSEGATKISRLKLCEAAARALKTGLDLLGIPCPERM